MSFSQDSSNSFLDSDADEACQELHEAKQNLSAERERYMKNKMLYDAVRKCAESDRIDASLKYKIQDILLSKQCAQTLPLEGSSTLLGVSWTHDSHLNYTENRILTNALGFVLDEQHQCLCHEFFRTTNQNIETVTTNCDDESLFHFRQKLVEQQKLYVQNLQEQLQLLEELVELRFDKVPRISEEKLKEYHVVSKRNMLRFKIAETKKRLDIFNETGSSLKAYREFMKDIAEQQRECKEEIGYLQELKEKYKQVSCKQFDEILKSYVQYKTSIEKKKILYNAMNSR